MKTKLLPSLCALCVLCGSIFLPACKSVSERPLLAQVAVQYATIKVVQKHPERAARVIEIATFVRENSGNTAATSVALLEAAVREQIRWEKLDRADALLVDLLIAAVREELVARLGSGPLGPEQALIVAQVATWIEEAARSAAPPPVATAIRPRSSVLHFLG